MASGSKPRASTSGNDVVEGLSDFRRALNRLEDQYPETIKDANYHVADAIVSRARSASAMYGGVIRHGARSLRASRQGMSGTVVGGGSRYPTFWGAEFGSKQYRQFKRWRGNQWGGWDGGNGHFLQPTIRRDARALIDEYMSEIDELTTEAFPD